MSPPLPIHLPCVLPPLRERHYFPSSSVGRSASWALVAVAFRPSAPKRRGAPVWALRLPTPYGLRPVPGSRRRSDPRRLRPASHIWGLPCPCAVYSACPRYLDIALRRVATTTAISPHLGLGDISPHLGLNPAQGPLPTHHTSSRSSLTAYDLRRAVPKRRSALVGGRGKRSLFRGWTPRRPKALNRCLGAGTAPGTPSGWNPGHHVSCALPLSVDD